MTADNKISFSCPIGHGTPDRCSPEDDKSSTSSSRAFNGTLVALFIPFPGLTIPRPRTTICVQEYLAESSTQSACSKNGTSEATRESQGLVARLKENAPWNVRYQKVEETLAADFCEGMERLGIGRPQQVDNVVDHFGCVGSSNVSVAASMNVDWEIDINGQDNTNEQGEEIALSGAERISRRDYYLIGFGTQFET
ncbi:hypothetical protein BOTCAL_0054g00410 [Botryotinia calthae]|uniref:Uncharacterized protein n=1 Tax=Botryotinia calthae TaxID=38488 RepID=A0A4Y8DD68_9HELO|nr:hypothetical protein BOTCAL_0054g00410 [Botryotinia calthae]